MADKEFRTIDEQISILRSRGLIIPDRKRAEDFLLRNNYYRVSGYTLTLRNHDVFYPSATFQNVIDIYSFDHELRHLLLHFIECIEVSIKSIYSYEFTRIHGATGHLDARVFADSSQYFKTMHKVNNLCINRRPHEAYLKHFMDDLHQDIPLWAYVGLFTISDISFLYAITEISIRKMIAAHYELTMNTGHNILGAFLHSMTIIRNLCAHGGRLFNRLFEQKPSLNKYEKTLLIQNDDGKIDNAHLYGFVLIMRRLLSMQEFKALKQAIVSLSYKYPFVSLRYYGFRDDWKEKL